MPRNKAGTYMDEWQKMLEDMKKPQCPSVCRECRNCTCKCRCKVPDLMVGKHNLSPDTAYMSREIVIG